MGKRLVDYPPELTYDVLYKKAGSTTMVDKTMEQYPPRAGVSGTYMKLNLNTIALELLRAEMLPSHHQSKSPNLQSVELESVVILDIQDLSAEVKIQTLTEATCRMKSLRIRDNRNYSEEYCFKTIFGPAIDLRNLQQSDSPPDMRRHGSDESVFQTEDILSVKFCQVSLTESEVDIKIGNIDSIVSLDTIVDLANTASAQALALLELTAPVDEMITIQSNEQILNVPNSNVISVNVNMMNSRLILLEDPTTFSSRALSTRCAIDVRYRRDVKHEGMISCVDEDICLMVNDIEGFITLDMSLDQPHQIMDPLGLTLNLKRSIDNLITTKSSVALHVEGLVTRLSLNDILLTLSILQRRTVVEVTPPSVEGLVGGDETFTKHRSFSIDHSPSDERKNTIDATMGPDTMHGLQHLTAYSVLISVGTLSTVILNTCDGQYSPLIRLELANTSFTAEGFIQDMQGHGSMILKADSYNTNVSEWEPIIDPWSPNLTLTGDVSHLKLGIESKQTLQFSITTTLLNTISHTYSLLQSVDENAPRDLKPNLIIINKLGVEVNMLTSSLNEPLFHLDDHQILDVFLAQRTNGPLLVARDSPRTIEIVSRLPSKVDLQIPFSGMPNAQIIKAIPLNINKTLRYQLRSESETDVPNQTPSQAIIDVIYEYQRYQPFGGGWKEPFMMGDPPRWCNRNGKKCSLSEVKLPDSSWHWIDEWKVDLDQRRIGKKMDSEGWDYAINFSALNSDPHGIVQPVDYARRRKWIRSRTVLNSLKSGKIPSIDLFCEFKQLQDGSRQLVLKSGLEIFNSLPFEILIWVNKDQDSGTGYEFGPILADGNFSIPLFCSTATCLKIKHAGIPCNWSEIIQLQVRTEDNLMMTSQTEISCIELTENRSLYMKSLIKQTNKLLTVHIIPNLMITNLVFCQLSYRFAISGNETGKHLEIVEEGSIVSGSQTKLNHLKHSHHIFVALQVGDLEWSEYSLPILSSTSTSSSSSSSKKSQNKFKIIFKNSNNFPCLILRLRVLENKDGCREIIIFSKNALIDYSGLGLSVESLIDKSESCRMIRSSGGEYDLTKQSYPIVELVPPFHLEQFKVKSKRQYLLTSATLHSYLYSDRQYYFSYLPTFLYQQTYITTPYDDRDLRLDGGQLIQFIVPSPAYVLLLFDIRVTMLPNWIKSFGYIKTIEHVTSIGFHDGVFHEIHYAVYGKQYQTNEKVMLGSNHSHDSRGMYTIFVLPITPILEKSLGQQITFQSQPLISSTSVETCWWHGGCGLSLFHTENRKISIGLENGQGWSDKDISLKILSTDRGTFNILNKSSNECYQLAYTVKPMPGIFKRTTLLNIIPRFVLVNCLDDSLLVKQKGSLTSEPMLVEPYTSKGWHKSDASQGTEILFRYGCSVWSLGSLDIAEVGTHSIFLPIVQNNSHKVDDRGVDCVVVNVEVKLSHPNDHSAVSIIFWRSYPSDVTSTSSTPTPLSIRNETNFPLLVRQADVSNPLYELHIPPRGWVPYGWANLDSPLNQRKIALTTDTTFNSQNRIAIISLVERDKNIQLRMSPSDGDDERGNLSLSVKMEAHMNGTIICVSNPHEVVSPLIPKVNQATSELNLYFSFELTSLGVSLVADETPSCRHRHELISLYTEDMNITYISHPSTSEQTYQMSVMDIQIDNYCETAIYPVLLRRVESRKSPRSSSSNELSSVKKLPFIEFAVVEKTLLGTSSPCTTYEYISFRILEFALEIDSGTIETLFNDFWCDLKLFSRDELMALTHPVDWIKDYNRNLLSPIQRRVLVDVYRANMDARVTRKYFKELVIHPMKMALTFLQTEYQGEKDEDKRLMSPVIDIVTSMATVELMEIKLNSFIVTEVVESFATLQSRIQAKFVQDLLGQLATIAGSLTAIGSPAGLVRNIGNGVQDFFYEPYLGLVQSPEDFFLGLKRGTGSLLAGVVGGTLNSAAAIVGTASSGLAYLSGDAEYVRQRSANRQKSDSNRDRGVVGGFKAGGKEVVSGFASGVTGIFTKPMEEAQKDGALGFFKGLGMGVAGVAVKPVLGIADGFSAIAHGISNEVGETISYTHVRPSRTFGHSSSDHDILILIPIHRSSCLAQHFVVRYAKKKKTNDIYLASCDINDMSRIILTNQTVFWDQQVNLWKKSWSEISHVTLEETSTPPGIAIYLYEDLSMQRSPLLIPCQTKKNSEKVYELFFNHSHLIGNPEVMLPLEELISLQNTSAGHGSARENSSEYIFGSSETTKILKYIQLSNEEIFNNARQAIENISEITHSLPTSFQNLDQILTTLIFQWTSNHHHRHICCATILNETTFPLSLTQIHLKKGKQIQLFGSKGYDSHTQTLNPQSCLVIFGMGSTRTMNNSGNVVIEISSPMFAAAVASKLSKSFCQAEASSGYSCFFREKTFTETTSKYVITIM
jgi:hypothetical protein